MIGEFDLSLVEYAIPAYYVIASAEASSNLSRFDGVKYGYRTPEYEGLHSMYKRSRSEGFGPEVKRRIMLGAFVLSSGYYDAYYLKALRTKALIKKAFDEAFKNYDVILGPAAPAAAPKLGESLQNPLKMYMSDIYTISVNLAGLPAMTVPCGKDTKGLPIRLQLIGNCFQEKKIIRAGYAYECSRTYEAPVLLKRGGRDMSKQYETVIGLEVHVELAANCQINQYCKFDRKNYFYPDNLQNYQISQLYLPICHDGSIEIETTAGKKRIGIHEIHMEEDAGKLIHDEWEDCSLVDYNRSGVPLIEIVSKPDMRNADEVIAYLEKLRLIIQYLGASDCKLQEGSMRADVNLSVREAGAAELGTRTEMKNLNSFKAIARAIEGERRRQIELIEEGKKVVQETRRWDDNKESSHAMRSKEDAQDYRYFPDPDLTPVVISDEWLEEIRKRQPELRTEKMERYQKEFKLPAYDSEIITGSKYMADLFEATVSMCKKPKEVSNWLMVEAMRLLKEQETGPEDIHFSPENLAKLITLVDNGTINRTVAKDVFEEIFKHDTDPEGYVEEHGLKVVNDEGALCTAIEEILAANPQSVEDYHKGKEKAIGFLVGQTMRAMKGKADPAMVNQILRELL